MRESAEVTEHGLEVPSCVVCYEICDRLANITYMLVGYKFIEATFRIVKSASNINFLTQKYGHTLHKFIQK